MANRKGKVLAASLTPLLSDGSIDSDRFANHVRWLLKSGCDAAVLFGTTGEGNSFSVGERKQALEALVQAGIAGEKLMVGTGCCALPDTIELTKHALEHGVDSVLVLPPFYYKNASEQGLHDTFARLIDSISQPRMKVYLYHFPKMAVVCFTPELIARLVASYPECIAGIKDSTGDKEHTKMLNERFPTLEVFAGSEMFLLDYLRSGGIGCISATTNVTAALAAKVRDRSETPEADSLQAHLSAVRGVFEQFPLSGALKGYLAHATGQSDWNRIRVPLSKLEDEKVDQLASALADQDYRLHYNA